MADMVFEVRLVLENDAMQEGADVAEALRKIADTIEVRTRDGLPGCASKVWDRNGNIVGHWKVRAVR